MVSYFLTLSEFSGRGFPARYVPGMIFFGLAWARFMRISFCLPLGSVSGLVWIFGPLICDTGRVPGIVSWVKVVLGIFRVIFLLALPTSPARRAGGDLDRTDKTWD